MKNSSVIFFTILLAANANGAWSIQAKQPEPPSKALLGDTSDQFANPEEGQTDDGFEKSPTASSDHETLADDGKGAHDDGPPDKLPPQTSGNSGKVAPAAAAGADVETSDNSTTETADEDAEMMSAGNSVPDGSGDVAAPWVQAVTVSKQQAVDTSSFKAQLLKDTEVSDTGSSSSALAADALPSHTGNNDAPILASATAGNADTGKEDDDESPESLPMLKEAQAILKQSVNARDQKDGTVTAALQYISTEIASEQSENTRLHHLLSVVSTWGTKQKHKLKSVSQENLETMKKLSVISNLKSKEDAELAALRVWSKQADVDLKNTTRANAFRAKALRWMKRKLSDARQENDSLRLKVENTTRVSNELVQKAASEKQALELAQRSSDHQVRHARATDQKLQKELKELRAAKEQVDARLHAVSQQEAEESRAIKEKDAANEALEKELRELRAAKARGEEQLHREGSREGVRDAQLQALSYRLDESEKKRTKEGEDDSNRDGQVRRQLETLKRKFKSAQKQLSTLRQTTSSYKKQLAAETANQTQADKELNDARSAAELLRKRVSDGDRARVEAEDSARQAKDSKSEVENEMKQLRGALPWLRAKVAAEQTDLKASEEAATHDKEERDSVQMLLAKSRGDLSQLGQKYATTVKALSKAVGTTDDDSIPKGVAEELASDATTTDSGVPGVTPATDEDDDDDKN